MNVSNLNVVFNGMEMKGVSQHGIDKAVWVPMECAQTSKIIGISSVPKRPGLELMTYNSGYSFSLVMKCSPGLCKHFYPIGGL